MCSICLSDLEQGVEVKVLGCGHTYHPDCITAWGANSTRCPECRHDVALDIDGGPNANQEAKESDPPVPEEAAASAQLRALGTPLDGKRPSLFRATSVYPGQCQVTIASSHRKHELTHRFGIGYRTRAYRRAGARSQWFIRAPVRVLVSADCVFSLRGLLCVVCVCCLCA